MKLKDINIFEQHAEKAVLGVGVLFLLVCLVMFVLLGKITVNMSGAQVSTSEADDKIKERAEVLERKLEMPVPDDLKEVRDKLPDYMSQYAEKQQRLLTPVGADDSADRLMVGSLTQSSLNIGAGGTEIQQRPYHFVDLPAVDHINVRAGQSTVDAAALVSAAERTGQLELIRIIGTKPPYDLRWVSIAGRVKVGHIIEQYKTGTPENMQAVPAQLWQTLSAIADVEVERQELLPDGTWGQATLVSRMPDRTSYREVLASGQVTRAALGSLVTELRGRRKDLTKPAFYPLEKGKNPWLPPDIPRPEKPKDTGLLAVPNLVNNANEDPDVVEYTLEDLEKLKEDEQRIARLLKPLMDRQKKLQERGQRLPRSQAVRVQRLQEELRTVGAKIKVAREQLRDQLAGAGFNDDANGDSSNPFGANDLAVLANDLYVEPGKTYRYRMRVVFINPMFGLKLPEVQAERATQLVRRGEWSDWTRPVETPDTMYYFLAGSSKNARSGKIKVWKFFNGSYQTAEFDVEPGDLVGGPAQPVPLAGNTVGAAGQLDFGTGVVVVDFDFDHKLSGGFGRGLTDTTTRLIGIKDGRVVELLELRDRQRIEKLTKELVPDFDTIDPELLRELDGGFDRGGESDGYEEGYDDGFDDDYGA